MPHAWDIELAIRRYHHLARALHKTMDGPGDLYVVAGLTRLTVPVVEGLARTGAEIVVVATKPDPLFQPLLDGLATIVLAPHGREAAFRNAGLPRARCLLALAEDDLENVQATVIAHKVAPNVPVVIRLFDSLLADQMERLGTDPGKGLKVRRAYSMSALSASNFVAMALGDEPALTMRFAEGEIPFLRLLIRTNSPLVAKSLATIERQSACTIVAHCEANESTWNGHGGVDGSTSSLAPGDQIVIGGRQDDVLRLAVRNSELFDLKGRQRRSRRRARLHPPVRRKARNITLLPRIALLLTAVMLASMLFVSIRLHRASLMAFYWTLTTAASGAPNNDVPLQTTALKAFSVIPVVAGGALLGVLFSWHRSPRRSGCSSAWAAGPVACAAMSSSAAWERSATGSKVCSAASAFRLLSSNCLRTKRSSMRLRPMPPS